MIHYSQPGLASCFLCIRMTVFFCLDMALCSLVLSPNRNRESEQSNSYTLNSIGDGHESCLPNRKSKEND